MIALGAFWFLFLIAAIMPLRWSVILLFVALSFGSMTVVPGSTTILPYVALAPIVITKVLLVTHDPVRLWDGLLNWRRIGLLTAFMVMAMVVTFSAPFLFPSAQVMALNSLRPVPLTFSMGNITQPLYLVNSFMICIAFYLLMLSKEGRAILATGLFAGASMAVLSGLIDMFTAGTDLLSPLRTANYAILETAEVANARRVIGFNTEASSYGALTLAYAAIMTFMSPASWTRGNTWWLQTGLALTLVIMVILSTSSSAYLGLGVFVMLFLLRLGLKLFAPRDRADSRSSAVTILAMTAALLIGGTYLIARPAIIESAVAVIDDSILKKSGSESANERGSWNTVSLKGLNGTGGYGVGVGSTRASSWLVAVLSSTGVLGALLMTAFLARCMLAYLPRTDTGVRYAAVGARYTFGITLAPAAVATTLVDFGVFNALLFAVMAAAPAILTTPRMVTASPLRRPGRRVIPLATSA